MKPPSRSTVLILILAAVSTFSAYHFGYRRGMNTERASWEIGPDTHDGFIPRRALKGEIGLRDTKNLNQIGAPLALPFPTTPSPNKKSE